MTTIEAPHGQVRLASGKLVPASKPFGAGVVKTKRFLVVIQFYEGDRDDAEELSSLIADLERTRNHEADILLMRRADCRELSATARSKLESKFDKVHLHACRRADAKGHPWGCNAMFYDLIALMAQSTPFRDDYFAFINLEPDAVPTRPGWIDELISEWKSAKDAGYAAVGFIHDNPVKHLNGIAVWAADIWQRAGGNRLSGGNPQVAFDIWHAPTILPLATETPLIHFEFRKPTITAAELFANDMVAVYHGVKDGSARAAVRARHITMGVAATKPVKRRNVYTYVHGKDGPVTTENQVALNLWRQGWSSRGWNPVVLDYVTAMKHPRFAAFDERVSQFPTVFAEKEPAKHQFYRWLALDAIGGGLLVDSDVLPKEFTPDKLIEDQGLAIFRIGDSLAAMFLGKVDATEFVNEILGYDAQPDDRLGDIPNVTDDSIVRRADWVNFAEVPNAPLVRCAPGTDGRVSAAMEKALAAQ